MRKIVLAASLISCIALQALEKTDPPRGIYLTPQEWQDLRSSAHCALDQVVYRQGEKECGEIVNIPSLAYQFGNISFKIKDLSLIIFAPENNKVHYITHEGSSFVGSLPKDQVNAFKFAVETEGVEVTNALDPNRVKYIILKEREARLNPKQKLYTIELQNGDHLSVQLDSAPIRLMDGHREFHIAPEEIVDLCFNGGVYGTTSKGRLAFSFLKDKYLEVHVAWGNQTLRLPWEQISELRRLENISLLENPNDQLKMAKASLLVIKQPESIFVDKDDFEKWSEFDFEASQLFAEGVPFDEYDVAFEADPVFTEELHLEDYSQIAFEPLKLFDSPDFFEEWQIAFENAPELLGPERISDLHYQMLAAEVIPEPELNSDQLTEIHSEMLAAEDLPEAELNPEHLTEIHSQMLAAEDLPEPELNPEHLSEIHSEMLAAEELPETELTPEKLSDIHFEMLAVETMPEQFPGTDLDEKAFVDEVELIAIKTKENDYIDEQQFTIPEETDSLDDALDINQVEEDILDDALSLDEGDTMLYVPHEIHTLGEYTQKTHSLVRDRMLEATVLPTDQYPTLIVRMPGFFVDRNLVSNAEYAQFVKETHRKAPDHWLDGTYPAGQGSSPVVNVNYHDAKAYAAWVGKRIPTESEWIRAANKGVFNLESKHLFKEWTSSHAYPSEGEKEDLVVIAPMMFRKQEITLIPHSAPREVITIVNENECNAQTGFRCVSDAAE